MNVILIGYRCTGKSSTGKELARIMELPFVDTDDLIEKTMKASVRSIVATHGWERFRKIESQILKGALRGVLKECGATQSLVIATGGGIILNEENVLNMRSAGTVVWLTAGVDIILKRMSQDINTSHLRPSLTDKGIEDEVIQTLELRTPLYSGAAHMEVNTDLHGPDKIAETIKRRLDNGR